MGALVAFLVVVGVWALSGTFRLTRRRDYFVITAVIISLLLGMDWALHHVRDFAAAMQRDVSASGRLYIWVLSVAMALRKPWLGYGYSAFWVGPQGPSAAIWRAMDWAAPSAHNGLVQIMLDIGFLGVAVFLAGFLVYSARALRVFRSASAPEMIWPLLFLVFLFLWNLTESAFLSNNSVFWMLYVSVVVTISNPHPRLRKT
jgi:exopolysaccharide production protein ExoQ